MWTLLALLWAQVLRLADCLYPECSPTVSPGAAYAWLALSWMYSYCTMSQVAASIWLLLSWMYSYYEPKCCCYMKASLLNALIHSSVCLYPECILPWAKVLPISDRLFPECTPTALRTQVLPMSDWLNPEWSLVMSPSAASIWLTVTGMYSSYEPRCCLYLIGYILNVLILWAQSLPLSIGYNQDVLLLWAQMLPLSDWQ